MTRILPGLCSITLRQCSPREVVEVCRQGGLQAIEWGGDIHVPHGGLARAREVAQLCAGAGLAIPSYGSYFRMDPFCADPDFGRVLDTAVALGATTIRVWAGGRGTALMDCAYRQRLVDECRRIAALAQAAGCVVGLEYHRNTATDGNREAVDFLSEVAHPAIRSHWQPRELCTPSERMEGLKMVLPSLSHLHVFQWVGQPVVRQPLSVGEAEWLSYLGAVQEGGGADETAAFLEFVQDDDPAVVVRDAQTLGGWITSLDSGAGAHKNSC